jgi:glycerophosphoryl diester phosphodiesterase
MNKKNQLIIFLLIQFISISILNYAQVKNIAHRGGALLAPENTLAAFANAIQLKADYFELDVQISADDSLMIMHDASVNRTTNGTGNVSSLTYAQLKTLDAGSKFSSIFAGEKIPTLSEALNLAKTGANTIGVVIEIKTSSSTAVQKVIDLVKSKNLQNRVIISSFNLAQITQSKTLDPTIHVQLFVSTTSNTTIDQVAQINGEWIGSGGSVTQAFLDYARSKNVKFNSWTINGATQMKSLIQLGVDAITTDDPKTLKAVLDTTPPTDVVLTSATATETKIDLKWQAASDPEGNIIGYEIYRSVNPSPTTLLAALGNVLEYTDETLTESQKYYYRVKAKNTAGLLSSNYSNEVSATTGNDITKPTVIFVTSKSEATKIVVEFSERVDQTTAETKTNYTLNNSATISDAKLALDQKTIILTTSPLNETSYSLTIKSVKDRAITPNTMVTTKYIFIHKHLSTKSIAYYSLDNLQQDSVVTDATQNMNNGIIKNGAVLTQGYLCNALQFDGVDDHVSFQPSPSFDINGNAVTVSLWAKLDYLPSDLPCSWGPLFDSDGDNYVLYEDRGNKELRFKVTTNSTAERPGIPEASLKTGQWLHIVGVYDGTQARIYLNGIVKDIHTISGDVKTGQQAYLGRSGNVNPCYFKGSIDNVQIFNLALNSDEILDLFNSGKVSPVDPRPSDVTLSTILVDNTDIKITWLPAINYESALMGYEIYRDTKADPTTLYATVSNSTEFNDKTNAENATFYYRVKAKNSIGLLSANYSNELSAFIGSDLLKPDVLYTTSRAENSKIVVEFNEKVDKTTAETASNYTINKGINVQSAKLGLDQKSVLLSTSFLSESTYSLTIKNVKDIASVKNTIKTDSIRFQHKNLLANTIAYYSLDDVKSDSVITDYTTNANNGTLRNGAFLSEGLLGNSLQFDGVNDYVIIPSSTSLDIGGSEVSVSLWTKLFYLPAELPGSFGPLFDSDADQYVIYADKGNKELRFKVTTSASAERPGIPETDLVTGQWIHIVGVYDGANAKVYLNGVLKDTHPLTGTVKTGQISFLGRSGNTNASYFKGSMDNIHVFNKALTQQQILELYQNIKNLAEKIIVGVDDENELSIPIKYSLSQNFPNPFNPITRINFSLPVSGLVNIKLYDLLGKEVKVLVDEFKQAGSHSIDLYANDLASGVYFYKMSTESFSSVKKLLLLK